MGSSKSEDLGIYTSMATKAGYTKPSRPSRFSYKEQSSNEQKLNWQYLTINLQESYTRTASDTSRSSMIKVESMADLWHIVRERRIESFLTTALFGSDLLKRGVVKPKGTSS
jgi:hypothetical protein